MKSIKTYLEKIEAGLPINYPAFKKLLLGLQLDRSFSLDTSSIEAEKVKGDQYCVSILHNGLYQALCELANISGGDRAKLATQNRSHSHKVSGSIITARKGADGHPFTLVAWANGKIDSPAGFTPSQDCIIIENLENFLHLQGVVGEAGSIDVFFGNGMSIANSYHKGLLSRYKHIYMFVDLDLGGLKIAAAVSSLVGHQSVEFMLMPGIEERLDKVAITKPADYLKEVAILGQNYPFLSQPAGLILKNKKTIEQEVFLANGK